MSNARYVVYSTVATTNPADNSPVAANTVLNAIVWDGVSAYSPGDSLKLKASDTLQIGDRVTS